MQLWQTTVLYRLSRLASRDSWNIMCYYDVEYEVMYTGTRSRKPLPQSIRKPCLAESIARRRQPLPDSVWSVRIGVGVDSTVLLETCFSAGLCLRIPSRFDHRQQTLSSGPNPQAHIGPVIERRLEVRPRSVVGRLGPEDFNDETQHGTQALRRPNHRQRTLLGCPWA